MQSVRTLAYILKKCNFCIGKGTNLHYKAVNSFLSYNCIRYVSISAKYCTSDAYFSDSDEKNTEEYEDLWNELSFKLRQQLYSDFNDNLLSELNGATSVQHVLDFFNKYKNRMSYTHAVQCVIILWDLQKIFCYVNLSNDNSVTKSEYITKVLEESTVTELLKLLEMNINEFNVDETTCLLLYLNKIGLQMNHSLMIKLINRAQNLLKNEADQSSLTALSRYVAVSFSEKNLRSYFLVQDFIPTVFKYLDRNLTEQDLKLLSISLNYLHVFITDDILDKYKLKLEHFIQKNPMSDKNNRTILNILLFLNNPKWRDKNTILISDLILLLKKNIYSLRVEDLLVLFEIFYKIQEPGDVLTDIQRCASKYLQELEEIDSPLLATRLKLIACILCFSSPVQRPHFSSVIKNYLNCTLNIQALLQLTKLLNVFKISDPDINKCVWDKVMRLLQEDIDLRRKNLIKFCYNYINYHHQDISKRRQYKFEQLMLEWIKEEINDGIDGFLPQKIAAYACFAIMFCRNKRTIDFFKSKIENNLVQFNPIDFYNLSKSLYASVALLKNKTLTAEDETKLRQLFDTSITTKTIPYLNSNKSYLLLKTNYYSPHSAINCANLFLEDNVNRDCKSSLALKMLSYALNTTNRLEPKIIEKLVEYVSNYKNRLLGFNAEKICYLTFCFGYLPVRSNEFFKAVCDIMLRDQERLNGLTYLQTCLSLSYFQQLPESFIKQIFNESFLEKLDTELLNCYYKDIYPIRVRQTMMLLNRSVCLDYPELNIPWFHQKYVEDELKKGDLNFSQFRTVSDEIEDNKFYQLQVKESVDYIFNRSEYILENVQTPYGYLIDFVVALDQNTFTLIDPNVNQNDKCAILILKANCFTKGLRRLKGQFELKMRHLEMFGYRVVPINLEDWSRLLCGQDRIDFIKKILNFNIRNNVLKQVKN